MKKFRTEIVCVIDKSGSMHSIVADAAGGFNDFVDRQDKTNNTNLSLVLFDTNMQEICASTNIAKVPKLTKENYVPSGNTALNDAVVNTINSVEARISSSKIKPNKVIFVILTDGEENSSKEFSGDDAKNRIEQQKEKGWEFIYLGANQDAFAVGKALGINPYSTLCFTGTGEGITKAYSTVSRCVNNSIKGVAAGTLQDDYDKNN